VSLVCMSSFAGCSRSWCYSGVVSGRSRRRLEHVFRVYVRRKNRWRPHGSLDLRAPDSIDAPNKRGYPPTGTAIVHRHDLFGGLIHEYASRHLRYLAATYALDYNEDRPKHPSCAWGRSSMPLGTKPSRAASSTPALRTR
jgi:hypothetical protein